MHTYIDLTFLTHVYGTKENLHLKKKINIAPKIEASELLYYVFSSGLKLAQSAEEMKKNKNAIKMLVFHWSCRRNWENIVKNTTVLEEMNIY